MRWVALLLLIANLGVFAWGWVRDHPPAGALPEVPQGRERISLQNEPVASPP